MKAITLAVAAVCLIALAAPARAQTTTTTTTATTSATSPDDTSDSTDVVTTTATTEAASTTTTVPEHCDLVPATAVVFIGRLTTKVDTKVHMAVLQVKQGDAPSEVDLEFQDDARFLKPGTLYLVTAASDPETKLFVSKVKAPRGSDLRCVAKDPIYTRLADGQPVPTGIFSGMKGKWRQVPLAFVKPLAAVLGALIVVVSLKHLVLMGYRLVRRRAGPAPR